MRKGKRILVIVGVLMSLALIGCSGKEEGLTDELISISADNEVSEDGNYVLVVELKDGAKNVEYTLVENGKIIDVKEDLQGSALKEYVMQGKKVGAYKYTLNAKDDKDNEVSKEVTVEVKGESKDSKKTDTDSKENEEEKESTDSGSNEKVQGTWDADSKDYKAGDEVTYNDKTYACLQGHTSQDGWNPTSTPALWKEKK
ncbi:carbohydrate-binding protein [Clostridium sp. LP20]|uniref:carbohydrate-binding protein n=1 Tax=Clostridium sp. LP20 TaxID=3418665 RepID=UPI003EE4D565